MDTAPAPWQEGICKDTQGWLAPIPLELDFLEKAKVFLKQYSMRQVAAWLSTQTGRQISHVGLAKRIKHEQSHKRKASTYRKLTERYEKALRKAEEYEERTGTAQDSGYFHSARYRDTRESFSRSTIEWGRSTECNLQAQCWATNLLPFCFRERSFVRRCCWRW